MWMRFRKRKRNISKQLPVKSSATLPSQVCLFESWQIYGYHLNTAVWIRLNESVSGCSSHMVLVRTVSPVFFFKYDATAVSRHVPCAWEYRRVQRIHEVQMENQKSFLSHTHTHTLQSPVQHILDNCLRQTQTCVFQVVARKHPVTFHLTVHICFFYKQ